MAQENWWDAYPTVAPSSGALPSPPKTPEAAKTTYRTLTPDEAQQRGLPPGKVYQESSDGKIDALAGAGENPGDTKEVMRGANLDSLVGQINRVQELYDTGIRDETFSNAFGLLDSVGPKSGEFDSAGQAIADQGLAAFRVPGIGAQSDMEARQFALANTPQSGNWDVAIEEKLRTMRARVDANRKALGLPPAQWAGVEAASTEDEAAPPIPGGGANPPMNAAEAGNIPGGGTGGEVLADPDATSVSQIDPTLAGLRSAYAARLQAKQSPDEIVAWLESAGVTNQKTLGQARAQAVYRQRFPNVPVGKYPMNIIANVPLSAADRTMNAVGQSAPGAALIAAGDAASGFALDNIVGATGGNAERARLGMDEVADRNPLSSVAGTIIGGTISALGVEGALGLSGAKAGLPRMFSADALYGAGAGAGGTDLSASGAPATMFDRATGSAKGAAAAVLGSAAGTGAAGLFGKGIKQPSVKALQDQGVPLTIGQQVGQSGIPGRAVKGIEDRVAGLPVVGDIVNARRTEGLEQFNSSAFDLALKPIGETVKGKVGEEAMQIADDAVSAAYQKALAGKAANADPQFSADFSTAVRKAMALPRVGDEVAAEIQDIVRPYMTGTTLSGDAMQQISRDLRAYRSKWSNDTSARRVGNAIDEVEDSIFGVFRRQAPDVVPEYEKARLSAQRLYTLERAVLAGDKHGGVFTPAQLSTADKQATIAYGGRRKAATGGGEFRDLAKDGQAVLPNKVPDSGTAGRIIIPAAVLGAGGAADQYGGTGGAGLTFAAVLSGAYTKAGQRILTKAGRGSKSRPAKALQNEKVRRAITAGSGASAAALTTQ